VQARHNWSSCCIRGWSCARRLASRCVFSRFGVDRRRESTLPTGASKHAQIPGFFAHPDVWGAGIAPLLMKQTCEVLAASDRDQVRLWTPRDAGRARRFYEKAGFALTGRVRDTRVTDWDSASADCSEVEYAHQLSA
jgi:GNAT superfamily N-acetyltransferase